jgi:hypothetical protein
MRIFATHNITPDNQTEIDSEIVGIMTSLGGKWIGQGTYLPTMVRDWEYEVASDKMADAIKRLEAAGFDVDFDVVGGGQ